MLASTFMAARALVLLGCGWIARRHAAAARRLGIPLLAASRDAARARAFAREFAAADAFGAYEDAVRDPRATGAIVCTPHDRHLPDALLALGAGLHVLVEKPIAPTFAEADRMISAAAAAGRILMVAENAHFMPAFHHVHRLIAGGRLRELRELHRGARRTRLSLFFRDTRGHVAMLSAFDEAMRADKAPETDGAAGRRDLAVVLAAYRSIAERRPVDVEC